MSVHNNLTKSEFITNKFYKTFLRPSDFIVNSMGADTYYKEIAPIMAQKIVIGPGCNMPYLPFFDAQNIKETFTLAEIAELFFAIPESTLNNCWTNKEAIGFEGHATRALATKNETALSALIKLGLGLYRKDSCGLLPIHRICMSGDLELLDIAVKAGADINVKTSIYEEKQSADSWGRDPKLIVSEITPLHIAAKHGNYAVVKRLVEFGCKLDVQEDSLGYTPHLYASENNHLEIANLLVQRNAPFLGASNKAPKSTALHNALNTGNIAQLKKLLQAGYPVDAIDGHGRTALHWACLITVGKHDSYETSIYGAPEIVDLLIEAGADVHATCSYDFDKGWKFSTHREVRPIHLAARSGNLEIINSLINHGALANTSDAKGATPLMYLLRNARVAPLTAIEIIRKLVSSGANVNAVNRKDENNTPLHYAAKKAKTIVMNELLTLGAEVNARNARGETPLHMIADLSGFCTEAMDLLLNKGATIDAQNNRGETPLHIAAENDCDLGVKKLIDAGADINKPDNKGATPLMCLLRIARVVPSTTIEIIRKLVSSGANVNAVHRKDKNNTPLHYAAKREETIVMNELLTLGAEVNARNAHGETPLHMIADLSGCSDYAPHLDEVCTEAMDLLLNKGATIDAQNNRGETSLHIAAASDCDLRVKKLIDAGADINKPDNKGETPFKKAVFSKRPLNMQALINARATVDQPDNTCIVS